MAKSLDWYRQKTAYTDIYGLSAVRRLPRIGHIRLGDKKIAQSGKEYPVDLDHFRVPPEVAAVYGDQPREIFPVYIPTENREQFFPQSLQWYKGSKLHCKGDGQTATRINEATGGLIQIPCDEIPKCPCEHYVGNGGKDCRIRASLMIMLPKVSMGGCYQITTGSENVIINMNSSIDYLQNYLIGRIAFVPLVLKRVQTKLQTPDGKATTKWLMTLEYRGTIEDVAKLRTKDAIQQLVAPADAPPEVRGALPPAPDHEHEEIEVDTEPMDTGVEVGGEGSTLPPHMTFPTPEEKPPYQEPPEIEREPGADEEEDVPFPEPEPPPEPVKPRPDLDPKAKIAKALRESKTKEFLQAKWQEMVVNNKSLTGMEKVDLQAVFMEVMRGFKR